jgi:hypothetical protein
MGFIWNGIHTSDVGIHAEARSLPMVPEPKIVTEEIPGRDGFWDFSAFNASGRVHYRPREWEYRCSFDGTLAKDPNARVNSIMRLFASYSGYLTDDKCKNVRWRGVITNNISLAQVALTLHNFSVRIRTQAFAEGFEKLTVTRNITGGGVINVTNSGSWHVMPEYYITGQVNDMKLGGIGIPADGPVAGLMIDGPELTPGENNIAVSGFTGAVTTLFTPLYIWGWE